MPLWCSHGNSRRVSRGTRAQPQRFRRTFSACAPVRLLPPGDAEVQTLPHVGMHFVAAVVIVAEKDRSQKPDQNKPPANSLGPDKRALRNVTRAGAPITSEGRVAV